MKKPKKIFKNLFILTFLFFLLTSSVFLLWISTFKIPDLDTISERRVLESTKIYDRTGEVLLYDLHKNIKRTLVPFSEISTYVKNATVAIEDAEFYQHKGIKPKAFLRSFLINLKTLSFSQGGSTITQQVVKNSILTNEKKITRKLKEWVLAYKLEKVFSKEEILNLYLNEVSYGGNIYGIEEASLTFFGKQAKDLDLIESAYLAAIPKAPTFYSPYGNNRDRLELRKNLVLEQMFRNNFIKEEEYLNAIKTKIEFQKQSKIGIRAPHFVMYVKEYLEQKYGKEVEEIGLKVITTLDYELQEKAEEIAKRYALANEKKFNAENVGLVALDSRNGQVLIMVGSRDYFDKNIDGNFNITLASRQPGSAFKPFVYATAFNKGYTPETVVFDLKTEFSTTCNLDGTPINLNENKEDNSCYSPGNYDNVFRGPVTLRDALAQSINVPAVKTLYLTGVEESLHLAKDMGIKNLEDAGRYGLTLVLGGGEVSLIDITNAYATFSNKGIKNEVNVILKIEDKNNNVIESFENKSKRVLPEQTALLISDVLSDNKARTPAFGENSPLYFGARDIAAKTGTTNDYKDAWIIGYSDKIAFGAWAGNNNNTSMDKKVAGFIVAPMWHEFVEEILKKYPAENFKETQKIPYDELKPIFRGVWLGGETYVVDKISGKLATEFTPEDLYEEKVIPAVHNILYWVDKDNPLGPKPKIPQKDSQFGYWEYAVSKWATENNLATSSSSTIIPTEFDDVHKPEYNPVFEIVFPLDTFAYNKNEQIDILLQIEKNQYPVLKKDFFVNGVFIGSVQGDKNFSFIPKEINSLKENNTLKVVVYDSVYNRSSKTINFKVY